MAGTFSQIRMDSFTISPLRGLMDFWFALSYNLFIPSGLKKMTQTVNQENMPVIYDFGLKTSFDGHLTTSEFLCDAYVIDGANPQIKCLKINAFLCDGYVIGSPIWQCKE